MRIKMFLISILSICMIAFIPSSNALPFHHNHCKTDSDCSQSNFYCYESRECVECLNCSFYNRQVSTTTKCAKNKDECGNCVSGMEAEYNFDGTFTCQPSLTQITTINSNSVQNQNQTINEEYKHIGLYISIPLSILVLLVCLAILIKYKIWIHFKRFLPSTYQNCPPANNNNNNDLPTNPPPPYSEKSPTAPPEEAPLIQETRIINDNNQRANPCHHPNWVNGGSYSDNPYIPPTTQEPPPIEDENTQPSGWSPASENPLDLTNQPISFSNILSATNPSQHEHFEQPSNQNSNSESSNRNPQFNIQINLRNTNMNHMQVINEL